MSQQLLLRGGREIQSSIPRCDVEAALACLGLDISVVQRVEMQGNHVTVTEFQLDEDGRRFAVGNEVATVTYHVEIA
jgi:hypothetical protein